MVYIRFGGVVQDQIIRWLNFMKLHHHGFVSTFDTIIATQALLEFSFRTHVRSITNMKLNIESSSNPDQVHDIKISLDNLAQEHLLSIGPNVWGHVTILAQGAGLAIAQLHTEYTVDRNYLLLTPPVNAYDLNVDFSYSGRNKSRIQIKSCARWLLTKEKPISGITAMEIGLPTGYLQHVPVIDQYLASGKVPRLKNACILPRSITFIFDYVSFFYLRLGFLIDDITLNYDPHEQLDTSWTCVDFVVERWYPVANLTRWLKTKVYDLYEPGKTTKA